MSSNIMTNPQRGSSIPPTSRAVLPGGCVVLAFPGCAEPVVNKPRRGRLPASVPSLSRARIERQQRADEAQQRAERMRVLENLFITAEMMMAVLRDNLRSFEAAASSSKRESA